MSCIAELAAFAFFVVVLATFEDDGCVGLFQEEEADDGVEAADYGKDPEYPAPAEMLDYQAAEEGA